MKKISLFVILSPILFFQSLVLADDWVQIKEKDGIKVFEKKMTDSNLIAFRGEGEIEAPIGRVASVIFDCARAKEWVDHLAETKVLSWQSETDYTEYDHVATPFIIKDRDFISHVSLQFDLSKKQMTFLFHEAQDSEVEEPYRATSKNVRGELNGTNYTLQASEDGKKTYVIGEIYSDPRGSIPKWLVNLFQRDWPYVTMRALRKQVGKPDIVEDPKILQLIQSKLTEKTL